MLKNTIRKIVALTLAVATVVSTGAVDANAATKYGHSKGTYIVAGQAKGTVYVREGEYFNTAVKFTKLRGKKYNKTLTESRALGKMDYYNKKTNQEYVGTRLMTKKKNVLQENDAKAIDYVDASKYYAAKKGTAYLTLTESYGVVKNSGTYKCYTDWKGETILDSRKVVVLAKDTFEYKYELMDYQYSDLEEEEEVPMIAKVTITNNSKWDLKDCCVSAGYGYEENMEFTVIPAHSSATFTLTAGDDCGIYNLPAFFGTFRDSDGVTKIANIYDDCDWTVCDKIK